MLADGAVVEAGPLATSERFARLLATSEAAFAAAGARGRRDGAVALASGDDDWLAGDDPADDLAERAG